MSENNPSLLALLKGNSEAIDEVAKGLIEKSLVKGNNREACLAAEIIGSREEDRFWTTLTRAYARFLNQPLKTDPGCIAKNSIIEALRMSNYDDEAFYLAATIYTQHEPVRGGSVDKAAPLRVSAAFALCQIGSRLALASITDLLIDPENTARAGAARALAHRGDDTAKHLLRLKLHFGDPDPEVLGECCTAYLQVCGEGAIGVVASLLEREALDHRLEVLLALGSSRLESAFNPLQRHAERIVNPDEISITLTAIGLLPFEPCVNYLLSLLTDQDMARAVAAIRALTHVPDREWVETEVTKRVLAFNNRTMSDAFQRAFG